MKPLNVVIEQVVSAPIERVWRALTDKEQMRQWYFDISSFELKVGFEFTFTGQDEEGQKYVHLCRITAVVPNKMLQYSWSYEDHGGDSLVTFELFPEGAGTRIKLTHEGLETFPDSPSFTRKNFEAGWTELITKLLPEFLAKNKD